MNRIIQKAFRVKILDIFQILIDLCFQTIRIPECGQNFSPEICRGMVCVLSGDAKPRLQPNGQPLWKEAQSFSPILGVVGPQCPSWATWLHSAAIKISEKFPSLKSRKPPTSEGPYFSCLNSFLPASSRRKPNLKYGSPREAGPMTREGLVLSQTTQSRWLHPCDWLNAFFTSKY